MHLFGTEQLQYKEGQKLLSTAKHKKLTVHMANCITVVSVSASFTTQVKMSCLKQLNGGDVVCLKIVFTPVFINTPITEFPLLCYKAMVSTHKDVLWTVLFSLVAFKSS